MCTYISTYYNCAFLPKSIGETNTCKSEKFDTFLFTEPHFLSLFLVWKHWFLFFSFAKKENKTFSTLFSSPPHKPLLWSSSQRTRNKIHNIFSLSHFRARRRRRRRLSARLKPAGKSHFFTRTNTRTLLQFFQILIFLSWWSCCCCCRFELNSLALNHSNNSLKLTSIGIEPARRIGNKQTDRQTDIRACERASERTLRERESLQQEV